jgi:alkyl hydroperoxide reductase subunit AhpF
VTVLGEREQRAVRELLDGLERDVELTLELGPSAEGAVVLAGARELDPGAETQRLVEEVARLSGRIRLTVREHEEPGRYPALAIGEGLVYHGLPWGYELSSLVYGIAEAGRGASSLAAESLEALARVDRPLTVEVYVTPT